MMRISSFSNWALLLSGAALVGCTTTGDPNYVVQVKPAIDSILAVPCQEAAGDKYFMDPSRVVAVSSSNEGKNTIVVMKADVRDAVCTLNAKGKVVSLVDTTPKSADQIAAEEAKANAAAKPAPVKKKKS